MSTRVYIGRLSQRASEKDVENFFRGYGRIRDVILKAGYGFVEFDDQRDADDAIYDLNGKELSGERVLLEFSKRKREFDRRGGGRGYDDRRGRDDRRDDRRGASSRFGRPHSTRYRLIVENLSTRVSWQDLKDMVRKHGYDATFADAHKSRQNEGIVCFESHSDLKKCMEKMQGEDVNGRRLKLIDDTAPARSDSRSRSPPRRKRSNSRSRSRSRSSRRSRSRSASKSRSRSPAERKRSASPERSPSPKRKRSSSPAADANGNDKGSRTPSPSRERSRSPAGSE